MTVKPASTRICAKQSGEPGTRRGRYERSGVCSWQHCAIPRRRRTSFRLHLRVHLHLHLRLRVLPYRTQLKVARLPTVGNLEVEGSCSRCPRVRGRGGHAMLMFLLKCNSFMNLPLNIKKVMSTSVSCLLLLTQPLTKFFSVIYVR